jgi:hypothetical protein
MGIGVQALLLMRYLRADGYLRNCNSVIELGSQQFAPDLPTAREAMVELFPDLDPLGVEVPKDFYRLLGLPSYNCIDLDGANDALVFDLNMPFRKTYQFEQQYDLVTNHGTTEHAFNQYQCFENVHDLTRQGGLMLHALPSQGYQNHSFFNYHPSLFMDLASANSYEILGLYYNIGNDLFPYTDTFLESYSAKATDDIAVFAVMRKTRNEAFIVPFDGRYYFEQEGEGLKPRIDVGGHGRIATNTFPLSGRLNSGAAPRHRPTTKFVLPVWGEPFTSSFVGFGLRQQLESRCLEIDTKENIEYIIVTDQPSARTIRASSEYAELRRIAAVRFIYSDHLSEQSAYTRLTSSYNLALADARVNDLYFFLTSDCFFSREVFSRTLEKAKTHRVVLCPALRVTEESFVADVNVSGAFDISGREALALALRHEHPLTEAFCLNNKRDRVHPLPAQILHKLGAGYVGRWTVMHPLAIRIANTFQPIVATIDFNYPLFHLRSWSDVAVLDSIEDGLTVSLTPFNYKQGEEFQSGNSHKAHLANLKTWVTVPWPLDFHIAQVSHPVRLLLDGTANTEIIDGERNVARVVDRFLTYVNSRKRAPQKDFKSLLASDLIRPAIDDRQNTRLYRRKLGKAARRVAMRIRQKLRRLL